MALHGWRSAGLDGKLHGEIPPRSVPRTQAENAVLRRPLLWASRNRWLAERFPRYRFARVAVRRFMPGEELEDALGAAARLHRHGLGTVLTRLGENLVRIEEADAVARHYCGAFDEIAGTGHDIQVSVKLTQLGLDIDEAAATRHVAALAAHAAATGNVVWVDIEDSSYVDRTIALFRSVRADHANVGLCLQAYLYRTADDLETLLAEGTPSIRLVKGAYAEAADVAYPKKQDVDENYFRLGSRLIAASRDLSDGPRPALASHDTPLLDRLTRAATDAGVPRGNFEIQMLYGIRAQEQQRLAREGHRVRVLISYGPQWFPWYVRRLAERPANLWFVAKSMFG